jgi:hypothetical protein
MRPTHLIKNEKLRAESSAWSGSFYDIFSFFFHSLTRYIMWWDEEDREGVFVDVNVRWRGCEQCRIYVEREMESSSVFCDQTQALELELMWTKRINMALWKISHFFPFSFFHFLSFYFKYNTRHTDEHSREHWEFVGCCTYKKSKKKKTTAWLMNEFL